MDINSQNIIFNSSEELSLVTTIFSLGVGLALSIAIRWHFRNYGSTLSNREEFSQVFPFILMTTILIITVVKSSIALSLGLVGALSIVRFRTPIKEPEELAYLFISIAAGLGLGAGQIKVTVVSVILILLFMMFLRNNWKKNDISGKNLFISIDLLDPSKKNKEEIMEDMNSVLLQHSRKIDLRRFDSRDSSVELVYLVDISEVKNINDIANEIQKKYPKTGVTFLDQNKLPSI